MTTTKTKIKDLLDTFSERYVMIMEEALLDYVNRIEEDGITDKNRDAHRDAFTLLNSLESLPDLITKIKNNPMFSFFMRK